MAKRVASRSLTEKLEMHFASLKLADNVVVFIDEVDDLLDCNVAEGVALLALVGDTRVAQSRQNVRIHLPNRIRIERVRGSPKT